MDNNTLTIDKRFLLIFENLNIKAKCQYAKLKVDGDRFSFIFKHKFEDELNEWIDTLEITFSSTPNGLFSYTITNTSGINSFNHTFGYCYDLNPDCWIVGIDRVKGIVEHYINEKAIFCGWN